MYVDIIQRKHCTHAGDTLTVIIVMSDFNNTNSVNILHIAFFMQRKPKVIAGVAEGSITSVDVGNIIHIQVGNIKFRP